MLFGHKYDIRAIVELEGGRIARCKCPLEARFADSDEIKHGVMREIEWGVGQKIKRVIKMYDASSIGGN